MNKYRFIIGIDTGVNTGFAVWDRQEKKLLEVCCIEIHRAMLSVNYRREDGILVRVEDARQRTWFGEKSNEKLQGAGSVKRDCKIWEDFLKDLGVDFEMVAPKNNKTKLDAKKFKMITGWKEPTNEHSRDAAMLVFGF
jgi:hypothetical protein